MDLEIISYTIDIKPLKPLPLKNIYCSSCKNIFTSNLKLVPYVDTIKIKQIIINKIINMINSNINYINN